MVTVKSEPVPIVASPIKRWTWRDTVQTLRRDHAFVFREFCRETEWPPREAPSK